MNKATPPSAFKLGPCGFLPLNLSRCIMGCLLITTTITTLITAARAEQIPRLRACNLTATTRVRDKVCRCRLDSSMDYVVCWDLMNMVAVPIDILPDVGSLEISRTSIEKLYADEFAGYDRIERLILTHNRIHTIHPRAFRNLKRLSFLNLNNNAINILHPSGETFKDLPRLEDLSLRGNQISKIKVRTFKFIVASRGGKPFAVDLSDNNIKCDCDVQELQHFKRGLWPYMLVFNKLTCQQTVLKEDCSKSSEDGMMRHLTEEDMMKLRGSTAITRAPNSTNDRNRAANAAAVWGYLQVVAYLIAVWHLSLVF